MVHFEEPQSDIKRHHLARELDELLEPGRCKDYCPNGLVLEGRAEIGTRVTGVTASLALRHATVEARADALFVHHGWFWRDEEGRIAGARRERIANGLVNDLNLYAFHLPLDVHSELGDNAQIGRRLGLLEEGGSGEQDLVCRGRLASSVTPAEFTQRTQAALGRAPLVIGDAARRIERVSSAWRGARAPRRVSSSRRWRSASMPTSQVKSRSSTHILRASRAWPSSPPAITPPGASGRRRSVHTSPSVLASRTATSRPTIRFEIGHGWFLEKPAY